MFFLGGFNSVLPYLVYLSLLWVLMIIGVQGKISDLWQMHDKESNYEEVSVINQPACKVLYLYPSPDASNQHDPGDFIPLKVTFSPPYLNIEPPIRKSNSAYIPPRYYSISFRGPPSRLSYPNPTLNI
jgi:hypothetical protein